MVSVKVGLFPMGSFHITSERVIGRGEKKGSQYLAKEIKVLVNTLTTGMSLRDKHMKEKLEANKYKFITVSDIVAKDGKGTAKITIRNITKNVGFTYKDEGGGKATAEFKLNLKDFSFTGINYQGVGVEDEVVIDATIPYDAKS